MAGADGKFLISWIFQQLCPQKLLFQAQIQHTL